MDSRLSPGLPPGPILLGSRLGVRFIHALAVPALLFIVTNAHAADPSPADREKARTLMDEGRGLRDKGLHGDALQSFLKADEIMHVPTTRLAVAQEQIAIGQLVEAETTLVAIVRTPAKGHEPEPFTRARAEAQTALAGLGPRVPILEIAVLGGHEGIIPEVSIDAIVLSQAARTRPIRTNAGHHVLTAQAGNARAVLEIDISEGESKSVTLAPQTEPSATSAALAPSADEAPVSTAQPAESTSLRQYLVWGGASLAGVGVLAGSITGILSLSAASAAKHGCVGHECPPSTWSDLDRAHATATISSVSFVVAGVGLAALGAGVLLPSGHEMNTASVKRHWEPWIGAGSAGVRGTF